MPIEAALLDILACPIDKQGLLYFEDEGILYNPRLRRVYRMADDHLVMLAARAEPASDQEHERLLKRAAHGDGIGTARLSAEGLLRGPIGDRAREAGGQQATAAFPISQIGGSCLTTGSDAADR